MEKFINATHLIQTLEDTKPLIDNSFVSAFQKIVCKMTLDGAIQYMQEEISAGGEFRRVVHAHWIFDCLPECSNCHNASLDKEDGEYDEHRVLFCPYCGAIMDEEIE